DGKTRGRPVGVTVDPRGALIVADDLSNTIWRVTPTAAVAAPATMPPVPAVSSPVPAAPSSAP
ncbi:MAG TPA: hypothetical protein VLZ32_07685, partial [Rhodanobacter sp.]|nr:hypothetical protein [Rhodanobacter sp.]